jgi:Domain of unknown function (DUF4082)/Abnormal spindle-like microcephaly-assoc'd, ASPM-SPD-2-Hydin
MSASATPAEIDSNDSSAVELGVKFKADTSGFVTGLRFYKAKTNIGTHVGHIWSSTGVLLGSATFTNETQAGWQQVAFSAPIAVSANTVYVASYFAPAGHYSNNANFFTRKGIDTAPLHALAAGASGVDGVYLYSAKGGFPTNGWQSSNYWVDVVYTPQATQATTPQLTESASALSFGSVTVNSSAVQSLTLTSSGTAPVTVSSASVSGAEFSLVAGTFPITLNSGQSVTLQVQFKPTAAGGATGSFAISSNSAISGNAVVSLSGTGTTGNPALTLSTKSLSFGNEAVNSAATLPITLTSSGTSPLTVNSASISGSGFSTVGGSFPVTLNPNQTTAIQVQFKPTAAGSATGNLTIATNSTGAAAVVSLSGTGTSVTHQVDLSWSAPSSSPDPVAGYHVYRAIGNGAAQLLNSSINTQVAYTDATVLSGTAYNYTVKSVDSGGVESVASNVFAVTIP